MWAYPTKREFMAQDGSIKTIDSKGRVSLGTEFAGTQVIVEPVATGVNLKYVKAVPAHEAWIWENEAALKAVRAGIEQAASGDLSDGPKDFEGSLAFAQSLDDSE